MFDIDDAIRQVVEGASPQEQAISILSEAVFTFDQSESMKAALQVALGKIVPWYFVEISTLGGKDRFSIMFKTTLEPKSEWVNGILHNARFSMWHLGADGVLEQHAMSHRIKTKFRKTRVRSIGDVITKVSRYLEIIKGEVSEGCSIVDQASAFLSEFVDRNDPAELEVYTKRNSEAVGDVSWWVRDRMDTSFDVGPFKSEKAAKIARLRIIADKDRSRHHPGGSGRIRFGEDKSSLPSVGDLVMHGVVVGYIDEVDQESVVVLFDVSDYVEFPVSSLYRGDKYGVDWVVKD